ncbi:DUF5330 domain-containing protein [Chenggangzhangella methanolivorans]|uniref:DUF5330 domain-containing protein n=1 Tax=Chenggangzhangella methanolivorans TaxID=1437009 RepID=A0A9E6RCP7_9HYPH|nr:DUF5330 domain-containing protein [Chenggangzhangella methanolivorans]QZO00823.1 DUF5330 domain-containing protein [Chenggangzhangella methanolivorans]
MFFLLRTAFWVSVLLMFVPFGSDPKSAGPNAEDRAAIDGMAALAAAGATISDVSGFCSRQPGACDVGQQALKMVGERAAAGAAAVQSYLATNKAAQTSTAPRPTATTTSAADSSASRNTLTTSDRKPAWRGPAA